jgi:hypothetical protein
MAWRLVDVGTGAELRIGSTARTFAGELVTLGEYELPPTPQSTGRLYGTYADGRSGAWYPSVIGAKFIDAPERESDQSASKDTARAKALKLIADNPRFTEASSSGTGYVIGGAKSDPDRRDVMLATLLKDHPDLSRDDAILMLKEAGY